MLILCLSRLGLGSTAFFENPQNHKMGNCIQKLGFSSSRRNTTRENENENSSGPTKPESDPPIPAPSTAGDHLKTIPESHSMSSSVDKTESKGKEDFLPIRSIERTESDPHTLSKQTVGATRWLSLQTVDYTDEHGVTRKWDLASRTTKKKNGVADAVVIITLLVSKENSVTDTLLVEQYRPPVECKTLEFPAGLIDEGETAVDAALRELQEETGYYGDTATTFESPELCMSPGLADETISIVVVRVDLDDPRNANPKQNCEEGEIINVRRVPFDLGMKEMMKTKGTMPISLLYSFVLGMEMGIKHVKK